MPAECATRLRTGPYSAKRRRQEPPPHRRSSLQEIRPQRVLKPTGPLKLTGSSKNDPFEMLSIACYGKQTLLFVKFSCHIIANDGGDVKCPCLFPQGGESTSI